MKIAIVVPSPVPFTVGGMEYLTWGLLENGNKLTNHNIELIKLPTKENDFWSIIDSYSMYYNLNLDHFDMVLTLKYPAWMIRHKNQVCYMAHRLRGLYDAYHFCNLPQEPKLDNSYIADLILYIDSAEATIEGVFNRLDNIKKNIGQIPKEHFNLPSPFLKKIITFLDNSAMSNVKKFYAISETVKARKQYFPDGADVKVVYPPSYLDDFKKGDYEYVFMVSRLDSPKRIDLLINAMKYIKTDIKLYIAGTGPEEEKLKNLAKDDNRIVFLGFITDEEVKHYYSNSLVIPYFPYDEDYGLITIEAMMYAKPVITTIDSGGPTEFVKNNQTGFVVKANPKDIAEKIEYFCNNSEEAKRMGTNAFNRVNKITWEKLCSEVLSEVNIENKTKLYTKANSDIKRKKIIVTSTFPVYPPQGGGQSRIFNLYKNVARDFDVEIVSLTNETNARSKSLIANGLTENRISKSQKHAEEEWKIESKIGVPVTDVAMPLLINYTSQYLDELRKSIEKSDIIVISHPYMYTAAEPYLENKIVVYEAHNVESTMKKKMLPDNTSSRKLVDLTFEIEQKCCSISNLIITCSQEDKEELSKIYGVDLEKIIVVPNGVDIDETKFTDINKRKSNKSKNLILKQKIGLFMGSWHGPNIEASEKIIEIAKKCKDIKFMLMGSQCMYFKDRKIPENVGLIGLVSEEEKSRIFSLVDFALNPMLSGSGTNLKMFDYMAAGIPIITTEFGTRGIKDKSLFIIKDVDNMALACNQFEIQDYTNMILKARKHVEEVFDWKIIAQEFSIALTNL